MAEHSAPHRRHDSGTGDLRTIAGRAMVEGSLLADFSDAAVAETAALTAATAPLGASAPPVQDMRARLSVSIDNDDSLDLGQLSVAEPLADGAVKIFIAIADVNALVKKGSAIDGHARTNTTSVYTAAQIFPMPPEKLSTDLTSLGEEVDRNAIVVEIVVRPDGSIAGSDAYRAAVRNHAKLAYNGVAAWLDGTSPAPARVRAVPGIDAQLRVQDRVAQQLRKRRFEHGALTLETAAAGEGGAVRERAAVFDRGPERPRRREPGSGSPGPRRRESWCAASRGST